MECLSRKGNEINEIFSVTEYIFLKRFSKCCFSKLKISELINKKSFFVSFVASYSYIKNDDERNRQIPFTIRFIESKEEIES